MNAVAGAVKHVVQISTDVQTGCDYCTSYSIGGEQKFDESINHYLQEHSCVLLHVGQQTTFDMDGKPWHTTVALVGSDVVPEPRPIPEFLIAGIPPNV